MIESNLQHPVLRRDIPCRPSFARDMVAAANIADIGVKNGRGARMCWIGHAPRIARFPSFWRKMGPLWTRCPDPVSAAQAAALRDHYDIRPKPEFRVIATFAHMDVRRLSRVAFVRVKVEAASVPGEDFGHRIEARSPVAGGITIACYRYSRPGRHHYRDAAFRYCITPPQSPLP